MSDPIVVTVRQASSVAVRVTQPETMSVTTAAAGPQGPPGPRGPVGSGSVGVFTQSSPAATWILVHNLGRPPLVELFVAGAQVMADVIVSDANTTTIVFATPQTGQAIYS